MEDAHQLRVFAAVAENLSFTRAAEVLFLTQSAVSHQIAKLEQHLGTSLFERRGRGVTLTDAGKVLLTHAKRVFTALADAEAAVRAVSKPDAGRLRIGASSTACQYLIPEALREFRECFPSWSLSISPGDSPEVSEAVLNNDIDLGLLVRADRRPKLAYHELFDDELGFLVSPLHPWAKAKKAERRELGQQKMVLYRRQSATFRMVERYFVKMRAELPDWIELGSMEAIKELVKLGLGVSIVAPWIARPELAEGSLVWLPLPGSRLTRTWCVAVTASRKLSLAEETFIGLCRQAGGQLVV
jgi:LysR family transcriptional regulator, low CO2-responsive transcriptional regulator